MNDEQIIIETLNEINNLHENVRLITHVMQRYTVTTVDDQNTYSNVMLTLADCIEMYVARIEVATERALREYSGEGAAA